MKSRTLGAARGGTRCVGEHPRGSRVGASGGRASGGRASRSRRAEPEHLRYEWVVDEDDDWTGTPPEGRYSRDRARPDFWRSQWQASVAGGVLALVIIVLLLVLLLR